MAQVTVNADVGESFGPHAFGMDTDVMSSVDLVNIACGWHAGDPASMNEAVLQAKRLQLAIGAHPGLPDLVGFGRREMKLSSEEVKHLIFYQVGALTGFLKHHKVDLHHIKPHGALYGMLARDEELMRAAASVASVFGVSMLGMAGTAHERVCHEEGVSFIAELYVDLDYRPDGSLIIDRHPRPKDPAEAVRRIQAAQAGDGVEAIDGTRLEIPFNTVCVHSDIPGAPEMARAVQQAIG